MTPPPVTVGDIYSNIDHSFRPSREDAERMLRAGEVGSHPAWNFWGVIWFEMYTDTFVEAVAQYGAVVAIYRNANLGDLVQIASREHGYD